MLRSIGKQSGGIRGQLWWLVNGVGGALEVGQKEVARGLDGGSEQ